MTSGSEPVDIAAYRDGGPTAHPRDCRLCEALLALARSAACNERDQGSAGHVALGDSVVEGTAA